ncbi:hypothetical protein GCM10017576_31570 [Microbacterium barkeri]|uniref:Uncharacterized protein n=1 Tax=Microbacterium barkeri TaxID=33917 RepID=A0A9W6LY02_9MICO|nr:hypothetical protein GCM10017576_31570 [Microbacterium barkeri]
MADVEEVERAGRVADARHAGAFPRAGRREVPRWRRGRTTGAMGESSDLSHGSAGTAEATDADVAGGSASASGSGAARPGATGTARTAPDGGSARELSTDRILGKSADRGG